MIVGHGIDLQEIAGIEQAYKKNPRFAEKVLTDKEMVVFDGLSEARKMQYLAGRWAAKEALGKALGTGIGAGGTTFQSIEVLSDGKGAPYVAKAPTSSKVWVSISHSGGFVEASVILEERDETK